MQAKLLGAAALRYVFPAAGIVKNFGVLLVTAFQILDELGYQSLKY